MITIAVQQLLVALPVLLVGLVGIVVALVTWRQHPAVSGLTIVALLILGVDSLVGGSLSAALLALPRAGTALRAAPRVATVARVAASLVGAAGWGLLLAAVFGWRGTKQTVSSSTNH